MDLLSYWQQHCAPYLRVSLPLRGTDRGASLVEYALLVGLIAMVCVAAVSFLGGKTSAGYSAVGSGLR